MAHSQDGINWIVDEDAKAYSRTVEWEDGNVEMQGQLERPFLFLRTGFLHMCFCYDGWPWWI